MTFTATKSSRDRGDSSMCLLSYVELIEVIKQCLDDRDIRISLRSFKRLVSDSVSCRFSSYAVQCRYSPGIIV